MKIVSLTFHGPSCHLTIDSDKKIHVLLDACHMLRLLRNTFAEKGLLVDKDGKKAANILLSSRSFIRVKDYSKQTS